MNIKEVKKNNAVRNFFPYLVLFIIIIAELLFTFLQFSPSKHRNL